MEKEAADIDRIIEIDCDTEREQKIIIRSVEKTRIPSGEIRTPRDHGDYDEKDIVILVSALVGTIFRMEKTDKYSKGKVMSRAMDLLHDAYTDTSLKCESVDQNSNDVNGLSTDFCFIPEGDQDE